MKKYPGPTVSECGVSDDIMALLALFAASAKDTETVKELCDYAAVTTDEEAPNEWLYGRAGYLYLLRLVRGSFLEDNEALQVIDDTSEEVIDAIMESPRPWKWHGKAYIGAAHGAIGIITQVVLTDPKIGRAHV